MNRKDPPVNVVSLSVLVEALEGALFFVADISKPGDECSMCGGNGKTLHYSLSCECLPILKALHHAKPKKWPATNCGAIQ